MKQAFYIFLIMQWGTTFAVAQEQQRLEVDISGMNCKFCVFNVEKNLAKLDGVKQVSVNLDDGIANITMIPDKKGDVNQIKELIRNAGFIPGDVRVAKSIKQ